MITPIIAVIIGGGITLVFNLYAHKKAANFCSYKQKNAFKCSFTYVSTITVAAGCLAITMLWAALDAKSTSKPDVQNVSANYDAVREQLAKVERGDFVGFEGRWYVVTATSFVSDGNARNMVMLRLFNDISSVPIYYNLDDVARQISRVIRWEDPYKDRDLTHALWTNAAREFFKR